MKEVLLVSPTFVRENSNISTNMQDKFLLSAIRESTNIDFQQVVGTKMLNKLKSLVEEGTISDESNKYYKELLDIAKYFIMYSVVQRVIVISNVKIDNIGANQTSDQNVQPLGVDDMFKMRNYYKSQTDFYENILQGYCIDNYSHLKELGGNCVHKIKAHLNSSADCSIYLGGARGKGKRHYKKIF